jgi:hypothetical protein
MPKPDADYKLGEELQLRRCPHCSVDTPSFAKQAQFQTTSLDKDFTRSWGVYSCKRCGGVVSAWSYSWGQNIAEMFPGPKQVDLELPDRARAFLGQAQESMHAPAGAIMLAASAVDAMLKAKGYKDGSLNARIEKAAADHLITAEMSKWAHQVRLDANDQRHADEAASLPTEAEARQTVEFAAALGTFLFTLPSRVSRGIEASSRKK